MEDRHLSLHLTLVGTLALLGGAAAIVVPVVASVAITIFIGWVLVFSGLVMGFHAWSMRARGNVGPRMVNAALALAIGIWLVAFPLSGTITLTVLLAVWLIASGAVLLLAGTRRRGMPGGTLMAINGALSVVLGILIAAKLPSSAAWAIGLLVGIDLIFWGVRAMVVALWLRRAERPAGGKQPPPARSNLAWTS
jgi:uncharacterized membrane protein HdeD (DUF308 family)